MRREHAIAGLVTVAGAGALAWYLTRTRAGRGLVDQVGDAAAQAWAQASQAIVVPARLRPALDRLAAAVPGIPLIVTSGTRSPAAQAAAMADKLRRGEDLAQLYSQADLIEEILAVAGDPDDPDVEAMADAIEAQVAAGRYISRHLREDAVDLRTRHLTEAQLEQLVAAVEAQGGQAVLEADHLHVEELPA